MASPAPSSKEVLIQSLDKVASDLDKLELPPEFRAKNIKEVLTNSNSVSILVTGKTGTGKSTLVNGLIGRPVAKVGGGLTKAVTSEVTEYCETFDGIEVTVWDSPGLQDGTDNDEAYLANMAKKCKKPDLVLYCIKMIDTRFLSGNQDAIAMGKLTKCFGTDFWKHVVIALTFANGVDATDIELQCATDPKEKKQIFQSKAEKWRKAIRDILVRVHIPPEIVKEIPIVPAGHHQIPHLHDRDYWLSTLWFECARKISRPEGRGSLIILNHSRFKHRSKVKEDDSEKPIHEQPIVWDDHVENASKIAVPLVGISFTTVAGGAALGVAVGSLVGGVGGLGVGAVIGAPIGLVIGLIAGSAVSYRIYKEHK